MGENWHAMSSGRGAVHWWESGMPAFVILDKMAWTQSLNWGTSAQRAELSLTQALHWGKCKAITVYVDSQYAHATAHVHGPRKRGNRLGHLDGGPGTVGPLQILVPLTRPEWCQHQPAHRKKPSMQKGRMPNGRLMGGLFVGMETCTPFHYWKTDVQTPLGCPSGGN